MALPRQTSIIKEEFVGLSDTLICSITDSRWNLVIQNPTTDTCLISLGTEVNTNKFTYKLTRGATVECGEWRGEVHAMMLNTPSLIYITEAF